MSGQKTERRKYERGKSDVVEYFLNTSIDNRPNEEESTIEESSMSEYSEFFFPGYIQIEITKRPNEEESTIEESSMSEYYNRFPDFRSR